jgi:hypothetical protein
MAPVDKLNKGELLADFSQSYGIGLLLANKELMQLAYQSQGWSKARYDERTGKWNLGKQTGEEWDATRTAARLQQTKWYNERTGNQREADNAEKMDATSYNQRIEWIKQGIEAKAVTAGADLSGANVDEFARRMLRDNWLYLSGSSDAEVPDRFLNDFIAPLLKPKPGTGNEFSGQAASTGSSLRQKAESYGVTLSDQWYLKAIQQMKAGDVAEQDLVNEIITNSKSRYGGMAGMISEARSVKDLADPYIQMFAQTLERNPQEIDLYNPDIQKAMQFTDPGTGQTRMKSLWEFEQDLRKKPEWGDTTRGRKELNAGAMSMLRDFGFVK